MNKIVRMLLRIVGVFAVIAGALMLYWYLTDTTWVNDVPYSYGISKMSAYISGYQWDGTEAGLVAEIPDEVDETKVTALGGDNAPFYFNSAAINPEHEAKMEAYWNGEIELSEDELDGNIPREDFDESYYDKVIYIDFTLKIGKNIRSIWAVADDVTEIHEAGEYIAEINRVFVECDPDNPVYYSENGILYNWKDGSEVDGFWYLTEQ